MIFSIKNNVVISRLKLIRKECVKMATLLNEKKKLCLVKTNGRLPELGNIAGPILSPCKINLRTVINMVQNGKVVYEVNPKNHSQQVLLTIQNVQKNNFPEQEKVVMPEIKEEVKPAVVEKQDVITPVNGVIETPVIEATETATTEASEQSKKNFSYKGDFKKKH